MKYEKMIFQDITDITQKAQYINIVKISLHESCKDGY